MPYSEKERIRRQLSARRLMLGPAEAEGAARAVADRLMQREEVLASSSVGIYWAHRGEISTAEVFRRLKAAGKAVFLPRVEAASDRLVFAPFRSEAELAPGRFGVLEPSEALAVEARDLEILVLPGLAFDAVGSRIGWGRGYYDRALRDFSGFRLALAYDFQVLSSLPYEAHDEKIEVLITEARAIVRPA